MRRCSILIRGYSVTDEDRKLGLIEELPLLTDGSDHQDHVHHFKIDRKHIQILANPRQNKVYLVIRTIESFNEEETGNKNVIKTLRIIDPSLGFKCVK
jgi:hypothetical protein